MGRKTMSRWVVAKRYLTLVLGAVTLAATAVGCSGQMECNFISTHFRSISVEPTDAKVIPVTCTECYWWIDSSGLLNVAGKSEQKIGLLGQKVDRNFYISFVFGEPSQGVGKDFPVQLNTLRGVVKIAGNTSRFKSTYGIAGIENRKGDVIQGAYRTNTVLQSMDLLGEWHSPSSYLLFGTFRATKDPERGPLIRVAAEKEGFARGYDEKSGKRSDTVTTHPLVPATQPIPFEP